MKKSLTLLLALALALCAAIPTVMADGYYYIDCDGSSVNMREGPSGDYDVIARIPFGAQVYEMTALLGSNYAYVAYNGMYGYVLWSFLSSNYPVPTYAPIPTYWPVPTVRPSNVIDHKYVTTDNRGPVNVRSGPSTNYGIVAKAPFGAYVAIYDYIGSWASIGYNGYYGYVSTRYLTSSKPANNPTASPTARPVSPTAKPAPTPDNSLKALFASFVAKRDKVTVAPTNAGGSVHMRWAPSTDAPVVMDFSDGYELEALYENGEWTLVYDATDGVAGFMMTKFLKYQNESIDSISG